MSRIYVMDKQTGGLERLSTSSDSFLLFVYIAAQMTVFPVSWLIAVFASWILHAIIDVIWLLRLSQTKYRRLPKDKVPYSVDLLARRLGMSSTPPVFINTTQLECSARVVPYMLGGAILMSAGMLMKAASGDEKADGIIAHELAHIENGDYALFRFAFLVFAAPFLNMFVLVGKPATEWLWSLASVALAIFVYNAFLRRRELYADARAMNAMMSRDVYLDYFRNGAVPHQGSASHPPSAARLHSLQTECIVGKISALILSLGVLVSISVSIKSHLWLGNTTLAITTFLVHVIILLTLELTKPGGNTIPMTYPEWRKAMEARPSASGRGPTPAQTP